MKKAIPVSRDKKIKIVAIFGPTAVGKSQVAVEVAKTAGGEIISADSMQIYRGIPVITDQPSPKMLSQVPHHLIAVAPLSEEYSAARYCREARAVIEQVAGRGRLPLLVGGTGLYVRGLLGGMSFMARPAADVRRNWETFIKEKGKAAAYDELKRLDPKAAQSIDRHNPRRLLRALEASHAGVSSLTEERHRLWSPESAYHVLSFALEASREKLYQKIEARVDNMLVSGAIDEVREALRGEVSRTAAQAIGFSEIDKYLAGSITLEETAAAIKSKSRRYAKRQLTWMRKMPDLVKIDLARRTSGQVAEEIVGHMQQAGFIPS